MNKFLKAFLSLSCMPFLLCADQDMHNASLDHLIKFEQGNSINYFQPYDTVAFVSWTVSGSPLIGATRLGGLKNETRMEDLLNEPDLNTLLVYLWSEPSQEARIAWLRKKAPLGYPILMLELAKELSASNAAEAWKWGMAGLIRTLQDSLCVDDASLGLDPVGILFDAYAVKFLLPAENSQKGFQSGSKEAIALIESMKSFPSPSWIAYHGMEMYQAKPGAKPKLKAEDQWSSIRVGVLKKEAPVLIDQISKVWESEKSDSKPSQEK